MKICVIGAGIGGLAAAAGLVAHGGDVTVFERRERSPLSGFGISVFSNGRRALDALGMGDRIGRLFSSPPPVRGGFLDSRGRWLVQASTTMLDSTRVIERSTLGEMLSEDISSRIVWGQEMSQQEALHREGFDVVVAADGIRSSTRATWPENVGIRFAGYHAWRGITSHAVQLITPGEIWGRGKRFGIAPLADGRAYWFATVNGHEGEPPPATLRSVQTAFAGWAGDVPRVLEALDPCALQALPIEELRPGLPSFARGRTVLLGDAAHAMTPDLGQGANQALEDAAALVSALTPNLHQADPNPAVVYDAVSRYDLARRPRAQSIAAQSRRIGRIAQAGSLPVTAFRDFAMRAMPRRALERKSLAVQTWSPWD